jgi:hypothetical protein
MITRLVFFCLSIAAFLVLCAETLAQTNATANTLKLDKKENMPKAKIGDFGWIAGHWLGKGLNGDAEEIWSPPLGNSMLGAFRLVKDGKVVFQELCTIKEEDGSVVLKVKHFDADLKGREEKDEAQVFPLVKLSPAEACFDGITFRKKEDGSFEIFVLAHRKGSEPRELKFVYYPAKLNESR